MCSSIFTLVVHRALEDMIMPLSEPITGNDGTRLHEIVVPKGTPIIVGLRACNKSKTIWGDDALEWKPERWLKPLPETVTSAKIPGVYSNLWVPAISVFKVGKLMYR